MAKTPHKYRAEFAQQAYDLCLLGLTDEELATHFRVSRQSIANWKIQHLEFGKAVLAGKELADATVAGSLYKRATGMTIQEQHVVRHNDGGGDASFSIVTTEKQVPPDTKAAIHWLHNRQPGKWSRKVEVRMVDVERDLEPVDADKVIAAMEKIAELLK
ncbi:helix-turn-helix domain-containing protein [Mesorhizobium sp. VNQ89]|uniref:helix-turn-helix domain-containing protein n=1 Tax=Mesorhizobium quangtriensis TaxID=3157709 RepID=UPI0032B85D41